MHFIYRLVIQVGIKKLPLVNCEVSLALFMKKKHVLLLNWYKCFAYNPIIIFDDKHCIFLLFFFLCLGKKDEHTGA